VIPTCRDTPKRDTTSPMSTEHQSADLNDAPRRRRFVIDLDDSLGAGPRSGPLVTQSRRRRWPKVLAILGMLFVAVVAAAAGGIYLWWLHYQTTPAYSLALLIDAVQRNDMATVDQLVNTDQIVNNLASQVTEKTAARYGATLNAATRRRVETLVPGLLPRAKEDARDALAKRVREFSRNSESTPFIVMAIGLPYLVTITDEDDVANVTGPETKQLELTMRRAGDRWKVTGLKDDALVQRIVDKIITDFPALGKLK